jgi:TrmH family RNA methyltransferase
MNQSPGQIASRKNPHIQYIRKLLASATFRQSEGVFSVEGVRLVGEAFSSGWVVRELFISDNLNQRGRELFTEAATSGCARFIVSDEAMADLSDTETPQGIVAIVEMHQLPLPEMADFILILDAIRDPGNVGTILRTASAAGVQAVILAPETADPFSPKVMRAGMGAQLHLPIWQADWPQICQLIKAQTGLKAFLADTGDGVIYWETPLLNAVAIIISNEANGPSPAARELADEVVTIPMPGKRESLNAAIAASLLIYEVVRQRQ